MSSSFEDFAIFAETHPTHAACVRILSLEARLFSIPYNPELMPTLTIDLFARIVRALPGIQVIRMRQIHLIPGAELASLSELRYHLDHFEYEKCFAEISVVGRFVHKVLQFPTSKMMDEAGFATKNGKETRRTQKM